MKLAWQQIPSPVVSELFSISGFDGVVLDTEHGCFNNETLFGCIQVITSLNKKCFVRLTEPSITLVRLCLDAGADGLIFSTVETEKQARFIHQICKYPDQGGVRGLGLIRQNKWGKEELVSKPPILIAQIETVTGVENFSTIEKYGFDFYMIGPYDLSASLGIPGDFSNPRYVKALEKIKSQVATEKMAAHIPKEIKENLKLYEGYGILALGMDTTMLLEASRELNCA